MCGQVLRKSVLLNMPGENIFFNLFFSKPTLFFLQLPLLLMPLFLSFFPNMRRIFLASLTMACEICIECKKCRKKFETNFFAKLFSSNKNESKRRKERGKTKKNSARSSYCFNNNTPCNRIPQQHGFLLQFLLFVACYC